MPASTTQVVQPERIMIWVAPIKVLITFLVFAVVTIGCGPAGAGNGGTVYRGSGTGGGAACAGDDLDCIDCRDASTWPAAWTAEEDAALDLINSERAAGATCGSTTIPPMPPLQMDENLREAARCHSLSMAREDYFDDTGSDGSSPAERVGRTSFSGDYRNQNLFAGSPDPAMVVSGWMGAAGQCSNVMASNINVVGLGYVFDPDGSLVDVINTNNWPYLWTMVGGDRLEDSLFSDGFEG